MNKREKQKAMIDGAVFESKDGSIVYRFDGFQFCDHDDYFVGDSAYSLMILKTPAPPVEYSTEYTIIPPDEMARLMVAGEVLEMENGWEYYFNAIFDCPFRVRGNGTAEKDIYKWLKPCRVKQALKKEKRYLWKTSFNGYTTTTDNHISEAEFFNIFSPYNWSKVEGSEIEVEV